MISAGQQGAGLASFQLQRSSVARLTREQREQIMANAHGFSHSHHGGGGGGGGSAGRSAGDFLSTTRFEPLLEQRRIHSYAPQGGELLSMRITLNEDMDDHFEVSGGVLGPFRVMCSLWSRIGRFIRQGDCRVEPPEDTGQAGLLSSLGGGDGDQSSMHASSEWKLVLLLAAPLMVSKLADEISMLGMEWLWGKLGTTALAAGNYCSTWQTLSLVAIYGGQTALYTMVPQASGAGNSRQVSSVLTMSLLWTCIVLLIPVLAFYWFIADFIPLPSDDGGGDGYGNTGCGPAPEPEPAHSAPDVSSIEQQITSYSRASALYLLPYTLMTTVMTWLECLEIVSTVAFIAACWTVIKVPLAYVLMFPLDLGLEGYAHAYTLATVGQLLTMWVIIGAWKKQHLRPERWWHGVQCKEALDRALNVRFIKCMIPMTFQMVADSAGDTFYYAHMASFSERSLAAYGVCDALTGTGGSFSLALWTAVSIRAGTLLGENDPRRARKASTAGIVYGVVVGLLLSGLLFILRAPLARLLSPTDTAVQKMMLDAIVPVCLFYFLSSVQYSLWGILQGQNRVSFVSVAISMNTWAFAVPFSYLSLLIWGPSSQDSP
jgi:Na+-driven multidrug efflux pump